MFNKCCKPFNLSAIICILGFMFSITAYALDDFWLSPLTASNITVNDELNNRSLSFSTDFSNNVANHSDRLQSEQLSFQFNQSFSNNSAYAFEYSSADEQRHTMIGYSNKNLSISFMKGEGEDYSEFGGSYAGIDPYQFHAGLQQNYHYSGYAVDYSFGRYGHMQFGQAKMQADGLLDRKAQYVEWSNNRLFARATQFSRANKAVGNGFDVGFAIDSNKQIAYQTMQLDNGANLSRIRLQLNGSQTRQYWVDLTAHRNPLYQDNNDQRIMFSFKTLLGAKKLINYAAEPTVTGADEEGEEVEKSNTALKRGVFIGVGVAAAVALSSSGDEDQDSSGRFTLEKDAAFDVLNRVNPLSVAENREYGGLVVINPDGSYSPTDTVIGDNDSVTIPFSLVPTGSTVTASVHTHAAFDPRYDNENFSQTDLESDRSSMTNGYLATPGGQFKFHDVQTGQIVTLGSIAN